MRSNSRRTCSSCRTKSFRSETENGAVNAVYDRDRRVPSGSGRSSSQPAPFSAAASLSGDVCAMKADQTECAAAGLLDRRRCKRSACGCSASRPVRRARVHRRSIDLSGLEVQGGDEHDRPLFLRYRAAAGKPGGLLPDLYDRQDDMSASSCANLHRSPLYGGRIEGVGPRYCPVDRGQGRPLRG